MAESSKCIANEKSIADTKNVILQLERRLKVQKEVNNATVPDPVNEPEKSRNIEFVDGLIKAEQDKIKTLIFATKSKGDLIKKTIKKSVENIIIPLS